MEEQKSTFFAAPCGLYCGICLEQACGKCHGCGCDCGKCNGQGRIKSCAIAKCAKSRNLESCAQCADLPCSRLIQFTCSPIWRTHTPCIENLRRQKQIGTQAWLAEQEAYWQDVNLREAWHQLGRECTSKWQEMKKSK
jgi:hypothetical protein